MTVESRQQKGFELDAKRLKVPFTFKSACPKCGKVAVYDLSGSGDHISYPTLGMPEDFYFGCKCGHDWTEQFILTLEVKAVPQVPDAP